jgi:hypothetical protein
LHHETWRNKLLLLSAYTYFSVIPNTELNFVRVGLS